MKINAFWVGLMALTGLLGPARANIVVLNSDQENYTFYGTNTYYVTCPVTISDTATFKAGTVIKYASGAKLSVYNVDFQTTSNNPAVFTSQNDDTVGEILPASTHVPRAYWDYADTALDMNADSDTSVLHVRVSYAYTGIHYMPPVSAPVTHAVNDVDIRYCASAIVTESYDGDPMGTLDLYNVRISHVQQALDGYGWVGVAVNCIFNDCNLNNDWDYSMGGSHLLFVSNSILANLSVDVFSMGIDGANNGFFNCGYWDGQAWRTDFGSGAANLNIHTPTAFSQTVQTLPNVAADITLEAFSPDDKPLAYIVIGSPAHGHLSGIPPNLTYTPAANYIGFDSFSFTVDDGILDSTNATVSIFVDNPLDFMLIATNKYLTNSSASFYVDLSAGTPAYKSMLINTDNFATATWTAYTTSNLTATLGVTSYDYTIWVGLKSAAPTAQPRWEKIIFTVDHSPFHLVITNPPQRTVGVPLIQLMGRSDKPLAGLTFDVSNAVEVITGKDGSIVDSFFDDSKRAYTTNYFQLYDIHLTNGLNVVTIHAADRAGNTVTTNIEITLDYSIRTNPPNVALEFPLAGDKLCESVTKISGYIDDPCARVSAIIVDSNNETNSFGGMVERSGRFWVDGVPIHDGTNHITLTVTDSAGNTTVTNFGVGHSSVVITINVPDTMKLWYSHLDYIDGTISEPTLPVWINGVKGKNHGDGTWSATNVPNTPGGVASFFLTAYEPGEQQPDGSYGNP